MLCSCLVIVYSRRYVCDSSKGSWHLHEGLVTPACVWMVMQVLG
jgi:hypothetical protein